MAVPSTALSLLSRCRDTTDQAAWRELDSLYRELLTRFCRRRGLSAIEAEDVVQDVFSGLARSLPGFVYNPERGRFRDYLFRCARNAIFRWSRCPDRRHNTLSPDAGLDREDGSSPAPDESDVWQQEWVAHHYRLALESVRADVEPQSIAVFDRLLAGDAPAEVARQFGLGEAAVYKIRQRIRSRMQELVIAQVEEEDRVDELPSQ